MRVWASTRCGPWARHINPSLVLVQPRKTHPYLTERLLIWSKESNQTNKTCSMSHKLVDLTLCMLGNFSCIFSKSCFSKKFLGYTISVKQFGSRSGLTSKLLAKVVSRGHLEKAWFSERWIINLKFSSLKMQGELSVHSLKLHFSQTSIFMPASLPIYGAV